jgi:hypothetical protein
LHEGQHNGEYAKQNPAKSNCRPLINQSTNKQSLHHNITKPHHHIQYKGKGKVIKVSIAIQKFEEI